MKIDRILQERVKALQKFPNIELERIVQGTHFKLYLRTPQGLKVLSISITPSDWRAWKNNETLLRQWSQK